MSIDSVSFDFNPNINDFAASKLDTTTGGYLTAFYALSSKSNFLEDYRKNPQLLTGMMNQHIPTVNLLPVRSSFSQHKVTCWVLSAMLSTSLTTKILLYALKFFIGDKPFYSVTPSLYLMKNTGSFEFSSLNSDNRQPLSMEELAVVNGFASSETQQCRVPNTDWDHVIENSGLDMKLQNLRGKLEENNKQVDTDELQHQIDEVDFKLNGVRFDEEWKGIIDRLNHRGIDHYRFSIEWARVDPNADGNFLEGEMDRYKEMIRYMLERNIKPHVTLMHFAKPKEWADKGGWEKEENIGGFVNYCEFVGRELNEVSNVGKAAEKTLLECVDISTINEPTIDTFMPYCLGKFPPFKLLLDVDYFFQSVFTGVFFTLLMNPIMGMLSILAVQLYSCSKRAAKVLKHQLIAHCKAVEALKIVNENCTVGITHQALVFESRHWFDPITQAACRFLTNFTHNAAFKFFTTGVYNFWGEKYEYKVQDKAVGLPPMDFIGLQKYGNCVLDLRIVNVVVSTIIAGFFIGLLPSLTLLAMQAVYFFLKNPTVGPSNFEGQSLTCMGFSNYPESLAKSVVEFNQARKKLPIHITENGSPSERERAAWMRQYLYMPRALKKLGVDIEKWYQWGTKNNEWHHAWLGEPAPVPGLGEINFDQTEAFFKFKDRRLAFNLNSDVI